MPDEIEMLRHFPHPQDKIHLLEAKTVGYLVCIGLMAFGSSILAIIFIF